MSKPKTYVGSGKEGRFTIRIGICLTDLPKEHMKKAKNGKVYINLELGKRKEIGRYQETHWLAIDEFVPQAQPGQPTNETPQPEPDDKQDWQEGSGDVPF